VINEQPEMNYSEEIGFDFN